MNEIVCIRRDKGRLRESGITSVSVAFIRQKKAEPVVGLFLPSALSPQTQIYPTAFIHFRFVHYSNEYCSPRRMREWNWQGAPRKGSILSVTGGDQMEGLSAIKAPSLILGWMEGGNCNRIGVIVFP